MIFLFFKTNDKNNLRKSQSDLFLKLPKQCLPIGFLIFFFRFWVSGIQQYCCESSNRNTLMASNFANQIKKNAMKLYRLL